MNVTILTYVEIEGSRQYEIAVHQVAAALRALGHEVSILGVHADVEKLVRGIKRRRPDLLFNMLETFGGDQFGSTIGVVGLLELLDVPFTGGGAGEFYLQEDKGLTKKLLAFDGISYPDFMVFPRDADIETGGTLRMPLFVKPLRMDASIGIDRGSVVRTARGAMQRIGKIHDEVKDAALVEEYIEGREFYVGVVGNGSPVAFPPIEVDFSQMPAGFPHIMDGKAKWDPESEEYRGTRAVVADLSDELRSRIQAVALGAYRALRVRDYGRVDLRMTADGELYVIEVNASCYLERSSELAQAAAAAGIEYDALIGRIAEAAFARRKTGSAAEVRKRRRAHHATLLRVLARAG